MVAERQLLLLAGEGRGGKWPGSTCGTALLLTYNSPATHTHQARAAAHTRSVWSLQLAQSTT